MRLQRTVLMDQAKFLYFYEENLCRLGIFRIEETRFSKPASISWSFCKVVHEVPIQSDGITIQIVQ